MQSRDVLNNYPDCKLLRTYCCTWYIMLLTAIWQQRKMAAINIDSSYSEYIRTSNDNMDVPGTDVEQLYTRSLRSGGVGFAADLTDRRARKRLAALLRKEHAHVRTPVPPVVCGISGP